MQTAKSLKNYCNPLRSLFLYLVMSSAATGLLALPKTTSAAGTWTPLTHQAPGGVALMMLLSDGTVMGQNGSSWYRLTPDINGSYVNGTWTTLAPMHDTRTYYSSQVLRDGRVFVAGGEYGTGKNKAEIYNALSNTWTQVATPPDTVIDNESAMLPNGTILEGSPGTDIRIYDPVADSWSGKITPFGGQDEASWVKLQDGSIMMFTGTNSERYAPALSQFVADANLPVPLYGYGYELGAGFLLPNGKAFYIGGTSHTCIYTPWTTNAAGIFTPAGSANAGVWTQGPDIPNSYAAVDAPAAMMNNGKILCCLTDTNNSFGNGAYYYEYDYVANTFTQINGPTGSLHVGSIAYGQQFLNLPDGTVLLSGVSGAQLYSYKPSGTQITNGVPTILSVATNLDGSFHVTGTLFNGISDGAAYGDDKQMSTAYPIARMTNSSGNVLYCRTYNWSTNVVMTGTNVVSTEMTLPAGLLAGTYPLFVTANGFSSAPYMISISGTPLPAVTGLAFSSIQSTQMAFHWNKIGLTETGYVIQRSTDGTNYSTLAVLSGSTATNYTDTTVTPLGQYYYQVVGTNSVGLGLAAPIILAASPSATPLPAPWQAHDIGAVLGAGASGNNAGAFTVIGSGNGIQADNDQFQFVYQPVIGDVTITARVVSNQNTGSNAMAGLMIRSSLGVDVADALLVFDGGAQSSIFEHRATAAALATYGLKVYGDSFANDASLPPSPPGGPSGSPTLVSVPATAPLWVRLVRSGNTVTSYTSTDGISWSAQGTNTVVMPPVVEVGLAVTSGTYNQLNTSVFDNVTVTGTAAAVPPPVAEWKLDETSGTVAQDSIDSFDGLYNNNTLGLPGATPATGYSAGFNGSSSYISVPALNLNSNVMTVTAWVNRNGNQSAWSGIFFNRANSTVSGFHFGTANELRYTWNNSSSTYNQSSGLVPPSGVWTFVALVIEPTRARIYMATNGGVLSGWTNNVANANQAFDGASDIGQDSYGGRFFNGQLDDVQFYNQALNPAQLAQMAAQPVVALTAPGTGSALQAGASVNLTVSLTTTNGHNVDAVEYFADNGQLLGQSATPPFSAVTTNLIPGAYSLFARLFYDEGYSADSELDAVQVSVQAYGTNIWDASGSLTGPQDGNGNWGGNTANWWNGSAPIAWSDYNNAVFGSGATTNCTVTLTNDVVPYAITFNAGTGSYTLAGSNNIWLSVPGTPLNITAKGNATIAAPLVGENSLVKYGNGMLTLTASNNYGGETIVAAGILKLGTNAPPGADVVVTNTGAVNLNGQDFTASMQGVPFTIGGTGNSVLTNSSTTRALVNDVELASDCTIASANTIFIGGTNAVDGALNLNGHTLTKAGSGTVVLNGLTVSGGGNITVNGGTLQLMDTYGNNQQNTALSGSGNLTINSGGSVMTYRWSPTLAMTMPVVMNGGTLGSGWPGPNGATYSCPVLINTNSTFNFGGGYDNCTFSGNISGPAGLTLTGGSLTRTFTGTNSYGWTTINAGILKIGNGGTAGTLGLGPVTNNANLTFSRSDTFLVTNSITGTGSLDQSGGGTLVLASATHYSGVTSVDSGTLWVNGTIWTNTVTVQTNATLGGGGSISGSVLVTNTATLAPGTNSPGVLAVSGKVILAPNSTNRFRLNKGGVSDEVSGSSGVTYGGTLIVTNIGAVLAAGDSFRIFGASAYTGTFGTIRLPVLGTNLVWDTSKLGVNGTLAVAAVVVITNQPLSVVTNAGATVSFSVAASGTLPAYQWYFNGTNIPGATLATLTLNNVQLTNAGNYTVIITNAYSSATSSIASLTVIVPPVFASAPQVSGSSLQFTFSGPNGQSYRVLGTTNLLIPVTSWMVLSSGTFGSSPVTFTDSSLTNASFFYQIASP